MTGFESVCSSFRARLRALLLQAGVSRLLIVALGLPLPLAVLDWWIHLPIAARLAVLLAYVATLGTTFYWTLLKPASRKWSDLEILRYLDASVPGAKTGGGG